MQTIEDAQDDETMPVRWVAKVDTGPILEMIKQLETEQNIIYRSMSINDYMLEVATHDLQELSPSTAEFQILNREIVRLTRMDEVLRESSENLQQAMIRLRDVIEMLEP